MLYGLSKIVKTIANMFYVIILVFGIYVIIHGHLTPGGGFQGGATTASAFALLIISYGVKESEKIYSKDAFSVSECTGLLGFIILAILGISTTFFFNFVFVNNLLFGKIPTGYGINSGYFFTSGTIVLMNFCVGIEVIGAVGLILILMASGSVKKP